MSNQYYENFSDEKLSQHKEVSSTGEHDRPCFYAFQDKSTELFWLIPISSKVDKYKKIYNQKIKKYKKCDTIVFGEVLGYEKAFLIQNMSPVTEFYIDKQYRYKNTDVRIDGVLDKEIIKKAKHVLALHRKGMSLIFPNVDEIEKN